MNWILLAMLPSVFWAFCILTDEFFSCRMFEDKGFLYASLASVFMGIPAVAGLVFYPPALQVPLHLIPVMMGVGVVLQLTYIWPYILALQKSGAATAAPVFQTIPVFVFLGGYLFLGEKVGVTGLSVCGVIMLASIGIVWDFEERKLHWQSFLLMLLASLGFTFYVLSTRFLTRTLDPLAIQVWLWTGSAAMSSIIIALRAGWRRTASSLFRAHPRLLTGGLLFQAVFLACAETFFAGALKVAPAAGFVEAINGLLPANILLLSLVLGRALPGAFDRIEFDRYLVWKIGCIVILCAGVAMLAVLA